MIIIITLDVHHFCMLFWTHKGGKGDGDSSRPKMTLRLSGLSGKWLFGCTLHFWILHLDSCEMDMYWVSVLLSTQNKMMKGTGHQLLNGSFMQNWVWCNNWKIWSASPTNIIAFLW